MQNFYSYLKSYYSEIFPKKENSHVSIVLIIYLLR